MPSAALTLIPQTYAELRRCVEAALLTGQREIEQAKVRTYHEAGRLITGHLQLNEKRPGYGTATIAKLARDLKISDTVLYRCVRFFERIPILARGPKLSWACYRVLLPIEDAAQRKALERAAIKNGWSSTVLIEKIRPLRLAAAADTPAAPPELLTPIRGTPGIYRIAASGDSLAVDFGFASFLDLTNKQVRGLKDGSLVRLDEHGRVEVADGATKADLYTYRAEILRVVDGDTVWIKVHLGQGRWLKQKLRLRALDCPEMDTPEGVAAKRFVEALVAKATAVTINTSKPDKYDRYLADVFLRQESGDDIFLNNALLENGHAVRKEGYEFHDWEELAG